MINWKNRHVSRRDLIDFFPLWGIRNLKLHYFEIGGEDLCPHEHHRVQRKGIISYAIIMVDREFDSRWMNHRACTGVCILLDNCYQMFFRINANKCATVLLV